MRKIYKVFLIILFAIPLIISSCKKEDEVLEIYGCTDSSMFNYNPDATSDDGTCIAILLGCIDSLAANFNPLANTDDGSCWPTFYEMVQGVWNINPDCEEYTIPFLNETISLNDQLPETIDVQEANDNLLFIEIGETQVNGMVDDNGVITVPKQTISFEVPDFGELPIDVEGSGIIDSPNAGSINLTYTFEIDFIPGIPIPGSIDCFITLEK